MSNKRTPLPVYMPDRWKALPNLQYKGNGEWSASCIICGSTGHNPKTGLPNRFTIWGREGKKDARAWCRQCHHFEWENNNKKPPSAAKIQEIKEDRARQEEREAQNLQARLDAFIASKMWEFYHNELTDRERQIWERSGIPESFQNWWKLGYAAHYPSKKFTSEALTIPYLAPENDISNLQYRLLQPPEPQDKYRMTMGLPSTLWLAEPDRKLTGTCLLCEGAKKAAVTFINVVAEGKQHEYAVIAVPSASSYSLLDKLSGFDEVIVAFDPDQYRGKRNKLGKQMKPPITRVIKQLDVPIVRVAKFPLKIDDMFVKHGLTLEGFKAIIDQSIQARPIKRYKV